VELIYPLEPPGLPVAATYSTLGVSVSDLPVPLCGSTAQQNYEIRGPPEFPQFRVSGDLSASEPHQRGAFRVISPVLYRFLSMIEQGIPFPLVAALYVAAPSSKSKVH